MFAADLSICPVFQYRLALSADRYIIYSQAHRAIIVSIAHYSKFIITIQALITISHLQDTLISE